MLAFVIVRMLLLVVMVSSLAPAVLASGHPGAGVVSAALVVAESAVVCVFLSRRFTVAASAAVADAALVSLFLVGFAALGGSGGLAVARQAGAGLLLSSAALCGLAFDAWPAVGVSGLLVAGVSFLVSLALTHTAPPLPGAVAVTVVSVGCALVARAVAGKLRVVARRADQALGEAEAAGACSERDRHRLLLHDQATVLHLLSVAVPGSTLDVALRAQAAAGAAAIGAFLAQADGWTEAGAPGGCDGALVELRSVLDRCGAAFADLNPTVNAGLAAGLELPAPVARVIEGAVTTLLHNVRRHAGATETTLHARFAPVAGWWEVTVRDNGVGFDLSGTAPGFGMARQVCAAVEQVGGSVLVESVPGDGTTVTLRGPVPGVVGAVAGGQVRDHLAGR